MIPRLTKGKATLVVLPKWETEQDEHRPGWVRTHGMLPVFEPQGILAPGYQFTVRRAKGNPARLLDTVPDHAPETLSFREPHVIQGISGHVDPARQDLDVNAGVVHRLQAPGPIGQVGPQRACLHVAGEARTATTESRAAAARAAPCA